MSNIPAILDCYTQMPLTYASMAGNVNASFVNSSIKKCKTFAAIKC
jgi:hypothetical protein